MIGLIGNILPRRHFPYRKGDLELFGKRLAVQRRDPDTKALRSKQIQPDLVIDGDMFAIFVHFVLLCIISEVFDRSTAYVIPDST